MNEEFSLKQKEIIELNMKDVVLDLYINSSKMLQRIIYYKENIEKDNNRVSIENIINLRNINKNKKRKKKGYTDNKDIFTTRFQKIGIKYDNLPIFESHFESGNLQLVYACQIIDDNNKIIDLSNINSNININSNNESNNNINDSETDIGLNNSININSIPNIDLTNDDTIKDNSNIINNMINIKSKKIEKYELFLHNDTNTSGYTQWFFFRVSNIKKGKTINFNIMNFLRKTTKYSNGIKIWVYSRKNSELNKIGWHHTNEEVKYYKNFLYKLNKGKKDYYYTLSFNYTFLYNNDEVFFANCIPFTYTDLNKDLNVYTKNENDKYIFFNRKKLCNTIIGNEVEFFSINNSTIKYPYINTNIDNKKGVVLFGRQHPSETVGSWTIKGAIDFLMGNSDEAKYLRDNFVFKIIPMINVDGVICGNTRTSLSGCDLNRRWTKPNIILHPEIFYAKEMITNFSQKYNIECIVDFHGHFGAFNSFFYGNYKEDNITIGKYFPFSCAKKSKVIQIEKSKFKMPKYKKGTGRINLFKELNIENVLTLETSYFGCNSGGYENKYFNNETLQEIGRDICYGILLLHYHNNNCDIILRDKLLKEYPKLKDKVENDEKIINNQFIEYINKIKEKNNLLETQKKSENSKNILKSEENEKNKEDDNDSENSDSESEPSRDNLDENEILKLMPPMKKLKKIFKKNLKKKKINKRNLVGINYLNINHNSNSGNLNNNNTSKQNGVLIPYKSSNFNHFNLLSIPKIKTSNLNKSKTNNISIFNINNEKSIEPKNSIKIKSFEEDSSKNKELKVDFSSKNILIKVNPTSPNIKDIKQRKDFSSHINLKLHISITLIDKATQTEEIFFNKKWTYFVGLYKIIFPKLEKSGFSCQLKPIKFNSFKNSYSFINKSLKSSILPPPQSLPVRNINKNPSKILNILRQNKNKINNEIIKDRMMLPFGPVHNYSMDKYNNKGNKGSYEYNSISISNRSINRYNSFGAKNQKFVNNPLIKSQDIQLIQHDDKKESLFKYK